MAATESGSSENQPTSLTTSGLPERERADRHPRGLAHRRPAEAHADVAVGEQLPEARLVQVVEPEDAVAEARVVELDVRRRGPRQDEQRVREIGAGSGSNASSSCGIRFAAFR